MAPFKSTLARSASKLLGVFRENDLSLRGAIQSTRKVENSVQASGGTEITSGDNKYHVFLGSSEQNFSVTRGGTCEILVVAGGGSGGYFYGAGGGAGGVVHAPSFPIEAGVTYKVSAGNGANSPDSSGAAFGLNGNASYFKPSPAPAAPSATNLYAKGGGGGGYSGDGDPAFNNTHRDSIGSGGGTVGPADPNDGDTNFQSTTQHPTGVNYSNRGASGQPSDNGGGGGGAGAAAGVNQDGSITDPASPGGAGRSFSNFPAPVIAPAIPSPNTDWVTAVGPTGLFAGGGTGYTAPGTFPRTPGGGGGWDDPQSGIHHGVDYTGGGGAGPNPGPGNGGNGIVIVYYPTA